MRDLGPLRDGMAKGRFIPFLGGEALRLDGPAPIPATPAELVTELTRRVPVPGRIRHQLWASAQYVETHRHRLTLKRAMTAIFAPLPQPNRLHRALASWTALPMIVDLWYDSAMAAALTGRDDWGQIQGVSRAEHRADWWHGFDARNRAATNAALVAAPLLLYKPWGGISPAENFLVTDADFVEVLTEIDIQSPIPETVRQRRRDRGFLFLGLRFADQTVRQFVAQIIKRSTGPHYAVIAGELSRNEARFLERHNIERIDQTLAEAVDYLAA